MHTAQKSQFSASFNNLYYREAKSCASSILYYLVYLEKSQLYIGTSQKINSRQEKNSKTNNNHKVCTYLAAMEEVQKR